MFVSKLIAGYKIVTATIAGIRNIKKEVVFVDGLLSTKLISKWKSESFIAGLVTTVASVACLFGYYFDAAFMNDLTATMLAGVTAIGGIISLFGRITATKRIK